VFLGPVLLAVGYALLMEWAALRSGIAIVALDAKAHADRDSSRRHE